MRNLKLYTSFGALLVGGFLGAGLAPDTPMSGALFGSYFLWAHYWGVPPTWRWWRRHAGGWLVGCSFIGAPFVLAIGVALFLTSAYCFSLFGGGLYYCLKYVRSQRHQRPATPPP